MLDLDVEGNRLANERRGVRFLKEFTKNDVQRGVAKLLMDFEGIASTGD